MWVVYGQEGAVWGQETPVMEYSGIVWYCWKGKELENEEVSGS